MYTHVCINIHTVDGLRSCSWADVMAHIDDQAEQSSIFYSLCAVLSQVTDGCSFIKTPAGVGAPVSIFHSLCYLREPFKSKGCASCHKE